MHAHLVSTLDELAAYSQTWDRLAAGVPFRGWDWMSTWWRHYGESSADGNRQRSLFVLCVFDQTGALIGIAPWFLDRSTAGGRVLRFLGSGEVCSDYLTVLCQSGLENYVAEAIADWLGRDPANGSASGGAGCWDLLELTGVEADDLPGRTACQIPRRAGQHDPPPARTWLLANRVAHLLGRLPGHALKEFPQAAATRRAKHLQDGSGRALFGR